MKTKPTILLLFITFFAIQIHAEENQIYDLSLADILNLDVTTATLVKQPLSQAPSVMT